MSTVRAVCHLKGSNADVAGCANFLQKGVQGSVEIKVHMTGLPPGEHGLTIHEYGDIGASVAGHYNPHQKDHGGPQSKERHVGDLGNVIANEEGVVDFVLTDNVISLTGPFSIIGRSLVVHENSDDLGQGGHELSKSMGNSGGQLACGVIGISK